MLRAMVAETMDEHAIREISPAWIPMPDGTRLAGRIWLPAWASAERPVPALLELIPYRTRDLTAIRDEALHRSFAAAGFASARIDIRGSGDSEGLIPGEYLAQELADGCDIIAWLAAQPWCTGRVGMFGNSWGGFNALQVAALRPPALGAIVTSCSTDDRFGNDMHYRGGALLTDMLDWGATFHCWMALPPDPAVTGPGWAQAWAERIALAAEAPAIAEWFLHQERDDFWRHGSVDEDYAAIEVPVLAVGGWTDGYADAIPRLLAELPGIRMGVVGPWAHGYPDGARPGPLIDFLRLATRWWERHLAGVENGIDDEPGYRVFLQEGLPPDPARTTTSGRWIAEDGWPSARIAARSWALGAGGRLRPDEDAADGTIVTVSTPATVGLSGGEWCPYGTGGDGPELPGDQAEDDARSVSFDGEPLGAPLAILGAPVVQLALPPGERPGLVIARLCDVGPDGRSTLVSTGIRHAGAPGDPGAQDGILEVPLRDTAYAFPAGHRIRVALSTTWWPMVWPEAIPGSLRVRTGASRLVLPVRPADPPGTAAPELGTSSRPPAAVDRLDPGRSERIVERDADGTVRVTNTIDGGLIRLHSTGVTFRATGRDHAAIREGDPGSAEASAERSVLLRHPDGTEISVTGSLRLTADPESWHLSGRIVAHRDGTLVADRPFTRAIPRRIP